MDDSADYIELVANARVGDRECLEKLAEVFAPRVYAYIYRITLCEDSAQDILQETMLEMFRILGRLKKTDRFWPWLCAIAMNKTRQHYRRRKNQKTVSLSQCKSEDFVSPAAQQKVADVVTGEIRLIVLNAVKALKPRHRAVLTLRCYEDMDFSRIAESMNCSQFGARMTFYRAKKALQRQLARSGLGKGALLTALVVFGKITSPTEAQAAQIVVTTAKLKVGFSAAFAAAATGKTALISTAAAGIIALGAVAVNKCGLWNCPAGLYEKPAPGLKIAIKANTVSQEATQYWYYFPHGVKGPVMTRLMKPDPQTGQSYSCFIHNDLANYYFDKAKNIVYINNYHIWQNDLSVTLLPTDSPDLVQFVSAVQATAPRGRYINADSPGLLVIDNCHDDKTASWITHQYNVLDEEFFRYTWPQSAKILDNRDLMHKRGWTWFRIEGNINETALKGEGRIPFVYAALTYNHPWISLETKSNRQIVNATGSRAFAFMPRPWMGLHAIDIVRRDAAEWQISFKTLAEPGGGHTQVILEMGENELIYFIDMAGDCLDRITFAGPNIKGHLEFSYLQEISRIEQDFQQRCPTDRQAPQKTESNLPWLIDLAENGLAVK
ncbi:MAG: sigma-70 family RNA polymerase sigma factor [Planctomycetota bacterium]